MKRLKNTGEKKRTKNEDLKLACGPYIAKKKCKGSFCIYGKHYIMEVGVGRSETKTRSLSEEQKCAY